MTGEAERLCAVAIRLLTGRQSGDPAAVGNGRMTDEVAANRLRIATALVQAWRGLALVGPHYHPEDDWMETGGERGANRGELRADIAAAITGADAIVSRKPKDADAKALAADLRRIHWHLDRSWPFA